MAKNPAVSSICYNRASEIVEGRGIELFVAFVGVLLAAFSGLTSYVQLDKEKRSEVWEKFWIYFEILLAIAFSGFAVVVIFQFWTNTTPPTRKEILLVIAYSFILLWGPRSVADSFFQRRSDVRQKAQIARMKEFSEQLKARDGATAKTA